MLRHVADNEVYLHSEAETRQALIMGWKPE